jgi:hypothetical protein
VIDIARDNKAAVEGGGIAALIDRSRRKPNLKNRVDTETIKTKHGNVRLSLSYYKYIGLVVSH